MKIKFIFPLILTVYVSINIEVLNAQNNSLRHTSLSSNLVQLSDSNSTTENYFDLYKTTLGITNYDSFSLIERKISGDGSRHFIYQQKHNNIPILGSRIGLHEINGSLKFITGQIIPNLSINITINIDENGAINKAVDWIKEKELLKVGSSITGYTVVLDSAIVPKAELTIHKVHGLTDDNFKLVYLISVATLFPFSDYYHVFIDANTGEVLTYFSDKLGDSFPGTVTTLYYGQKTIIADAGNLFQQYRLIDNTRGNGIQTRRCFPAFPVCTNPFLNDEDNNWNDNYEKRIHGSTHYAAENVWDYYLNQLGRNGPDENGKGISIQTDMSGDNLNWRNENNSSFNPMRIFLRGPISGKTNPRVSINSIGHEFTHGVVADDAGWNNVNLYGLENSEAYAMMEGYCDIFAEFAEFNDQGWVDWIYDAESLIQNTDWRVFSPPVLNSEQSMFYGDSNWNNNTNGHARGGILSHWAKILSIGEIDQNHLNNNYCVTGIGIKKVERILYKVLNDGWLAYTSNYSDLRYASIFVAAQLYGNNSIEVAQTISAWYAVNVGNAFNGQIDIQNVTINTPQNFNYNSQVTMYNVFTNVGANLVVTSNTEIQMFDVIDMNNGSEVSLYISPACIGGARPANPNNNNPLGLLNEYSSVTINSISKNNTQTKQSQTSSNLSIMPNPNNGNFILTLNNNLELPNMIVIRDVNGRIIKTLEKPELFSYNLNLSSESSGIYLISAYYSNEIISKKVIKN